MDVYDKLALQTGMTRTDIKNIYRGYWKAVSAFLERFSWQDFYKDPTMKTSVNIQRLGKFYIDKRKIDKRRLKNNENKKDNCSEHTGSDNGK